MHTVDVQLDTFDKDPDDVMDYQWDWRSSWLHEGENITAATVTVVTIGSDLVIDSAPFTNDNVTAWLSGGAALPVTQITCHIETNQGRQKDSSMYIVRKED